MLCFISLLIFFFFVTLGINWCVRVFVKGNYVTSPKRKRKKGKKEDGNDRGEDTAVWRDVKVDSGHCDKLKKETREEGGKSHERGEKNGERGQMIMERIREEKERREEEREGEQKGWRMEKAE